MLNFLSTSYAYTIPPLLGFSVFLFLSIISLLRGRKGPANTLFAALCFLGALINADVALVSLIPDKGLALKIDRFIYFFFVFSLPVFIKFVHTFVGITKRVWLEYLAYLSSLVFLFFTPSSLFISGLQSYRFGTIAKAGPVYHVFAAVTGLTVCYCFFTLFFAMRRAKDNELRNRIKYILMGIGLSILLLILNIFPILGFSIYPPGNFSFIPAIFLAFGVLKYDLLDIGAVIRRSTAYFILTATLTLFYIVIIYLVNTSLAVTGESSVTLPLFLALFMVLLFNPINERVRKSIDSLFFRRRYDYPQLLKAISGEMASLLKLYQIRELLLQSISTALQVGHASLLLYDNARDRFLRYSCDFRGGMDIEEEEWFDRAHPVVKFLESSQEPLSKMAVERFGHRYGQKEHILQLFEDIKATILIPMLSQKQLLGMIALGDKKSGELLVHEDMELLTTIANQAVTAIENARAYEEVEKLTLELERKVAQRTASLRKTLEEKDKTQKQLVQ